MAYIKKILLRFLHRLVLRLLPRTRWGDYIYALIFFIMAHRRLPNRKTMNDRLFRLKTGDEITSPLRRFTSDKEYVKLYIKAIVGDKYNVPTRAVLRTPAEIDEFAFRKGDVVKPTNASGFVSFVDDAKYIDRALIRSWLEIDYYALRREANYRGLEPKIIIEPVVFGKTDVDDIKFFCVGGKVKIIQWDFDRHTNHTRKFHDRNWKDLKATTAYPLSQKTQPKPRNLKRMIAIAESLARKFDFVRVDMYYDTGSGKFLVGELTHLHGSANERFNTRNAEKRVSRILFADGR